MWTSSSSTPSWPFFLGLLRITVMTIAGVCRFRPKTIIIIVVAALVMVVNSFSIAQPSRKVSAILFDIDGTLVNSDPIHFAVFQELLLKEDGFHNNEPIDENFFRKWISGRVNSMITADFFPEWPIDKRERWSIQKEQRFREVAAASMKERQMPGLDRVSAWVDSMRVGKAAVTNAPRLNAEAMLAGIHYDEWFGKDLLIIGDECEKPKPDPCPYLTACQRLGVSADECIIFEDSPSGVRAGVASGAFVIGLLSGQEEKTLQEAGCHLVIKDFDDSKLWKLLDTLPVAPLSSAVTNTDSSSSSGQ